MNVSIIVPAHNEKEYIKGCLDSLLAQSYKDFEIIVVVDGDSDHMSRIVRKYPKVKVIINKDVGGSAKARNLGMLAAKYDNFAFIDADCVADVDWLKNLVKGLKHFNAVVGHSYSFKESKWAIVQDSYYQDWLKKHKRGTRMFSFDTRNSAVKKRAIDRIGMFDEDLRVSVDHELGIRMLKSHMPIGFVKDAEVTHHDRKSIWGYYKLAKNSVPSHYKISKKHKIPLPYSIKKAEAFAFSVLMLIATLIICAAFKAPYTLLAFGAFILLYSFIPEIKSLFMFLTFRKGLYSFMFDVVKEKGFKIGTLIYTLSLK